LRDHADAEDAAQQVFLKGLADIDKLENEERFGVWIGRIARNYCIDVLRRQKRQRRVLAEQAAGQGDMEQERIREYPELEAALSRLPEEYRLCLMLYYFDGRSVKSVAETLRISESAVHARMSRARRKLRELLGQIGGE